MKSRLLLPFLAVVGTAAVSFGINALAATFSEPASAPPSSDAYAPLDTSATANAKVGGLILNTGGATNGLIVQSGNVGIGTTNPTAKLELNQENSSGWNGNLDAFSVYSPDNNYHLNLNTYIVGSGNVGYQFSPNGNTGMVITTPGNVGIGTTNPTGLLQLHDASSAGDLVIAPGGSGAGTNYIGTGGGAFGADNSMVFNVPSGHGFEFAENNGDAMKIDPSGNVTATDFCTTSGLCLRTKTTVSQQQHTTMGGTTGAFDLGTHNFCSLSGIGFSNSNAYVTNAYVYPSGSPDSVTGKYDWILSVAAVGGYTYTTTTCLDTN